MTDGQPESEPNVPARSVPSRRWRWTLAVAIFTAAVCWWTIVEPYRRIRTAQAVLEAEQAVVTTSIRGPEWLQLVNFGGVLDSIVEIQLHKTPPSSLPGGHFREGLHDLQRILIFKTDLTGQDIALLRKLPELQFVSLSSGRLNEQACDQLATFESLRGLYLHQTNVDDAALAKLAQLTELQSLAVTDAPITDDGLLSLRSLTQLRTLNLGHTQVTDKGVEAFQQAVPNCDVFHK